MKKTITFPNTIMLLNTQVSLQSPKSLGLTANVFIQEKARSLPLYNQSIECDAEGQSKEGKKIEVNTVGRWLFGVPGYDGHIRIVSENDKVLLNYPKDSPEVVHELIASLKEAVEAK